MKIATSSLSSAFVSRLLVTTLVIFFCSSLYDNYQCNVYSSDKRAISRSTFSLPGIAVADALPFKRMGKDKKKKDDESDFGGDENNRRDGDGNKEPSPPVSSSSSVSLATIVHSFFDVPKEEQKEEEQEGSRRTKEAKAHAVPSTHGRISRDGLYREIQNAVETDDVKDFLVTVRRKLHRHPELMYQESFTSETIQFVLNELGITFTTGWGNNTHTDIIPGPGGYGVVAQIGTGEEPCIILRADIDALPITEQTDNVSEFRSLEQGKMHACGHDGHTTMLLGAAHILKQMETSIVGTIRLVFQPAEEGGAGALRMVEEGVIKQQPMASYAFGMHVWPTLPSGTIASRPGVLLAAADMFEIKIVGKGGHAAMPHLTVDPIVTGAAIVSSLQTLVARTLSPLESGVVSVTGFSTGEAGASGGDGGGGAFNVIPGAVTLKGTIRALDMDTLGLLRERLERVVNGTASAHGCTITGIRYLPDSYPPTLNDPTLFREFSKYVGAIVSPEEILRSTEPTMGGEDFAFIAATIPSTFFFLGQGGGEIEKDQEEPTTRTATSTDADDGGNTDSGHLRGNKNDGPPTDYGLHHPHFALDENVLQLGVELHVNIALRSLKRLLLIASPLDSSSGNKLSSTISDSNLLLSTESEVEEL